MFSIQQDWYASRVILPRIVRVPLRGVLGSYDAFYVLPIQFLYKIQYRNLASQLGVLRS